MTVDKIDKWIGGKYVHLKFNCGSNGLFSVKLPPELAKLAGKDKLEEVALAPLKSDVLRLLRLRAKELEKSGKSEMED